MPECSDFNRRKNPGINSNNQNLTEEVLTKSLIWFPLFIYANDIWMDHDMAYYIFMAAHFAFSEKK